MRRTLVLFVTQLLLWTLVSQLNHALTGARVALFVGALYVAYAALTQPLASGLAAAVLSGLLCDSAAPLWLEVDFTPHWNLAQALLYGLAHGHTLLFAIGCVVLYHLRDRLPHDGAVGLVVVALIANLALFFVFSFMYVTHSPAPAAIWPRLIADLLYSQIFLVLIAPWFFALQARALILAGVDRRTFG